MVLTSSHEVIAPSEQEKQVSFGQGQVMSNSCLSEVLSMEDSDPDLS